MCIRDRKPRPHRNTHPGSVCPQCRRERPHPPEQPPDTSNLEAAESEAFAHPSRKPDKQSILRLHLEQSPLQGTIRRAGTSCQPPLVLLVQVESWDYSEEKRSEAFLLSIFCLLYTSDAADDLLCVDLGGRRIIKKKKNKKKNKQ